MGAVIKIDKILEALEYPEDWECFLDRNTGEVIVITDNEAPYIGQDDEGEAEDFADLPEWQRQTIEEVRRALESADLVPLPDRFDVHEWGIMRSFSGSRPEPARTELLHAIHGTGAFRSFRVALDRLGLRDEWHKYRDDSLRQMVKDWLSVNGIPFTEE
jgi:hypothetical protein